MALSPRRQYSPIRPYSPGTYPIQSYLQAGEEEGYKQTNTLGSPKYGRFKPDNEVGDAMVKIEETS